jgi:restriction system protein
LWHQAQEQEGEVLLYENPIVIAAPALAADVAAVPVQAWQGLLKSLAGDPNRLFDLSPRKFEELVALLLREQGYEVEITRFSKDGGKDLIVASPTSLGSFLYYVQCKLYSPRHRVGVEPVRELYGVVEHDRATAGLLVTTSSFTRGAREFQLPVKQRLSLHDYDSLVSWLDKYAR